MFTLSIYLNSSDRPTDYLIESTTYLIGRDPNCHIRIVGNKYISRLHCTLTLVEENEESYCLIKDGVLFGKGSANGTWIANDIWAKGKRILAAYKLKHQDVITFSRESYPKAIFLEPRQENDDGTYSNEYIE